MKPTASTLKKIEKAVFNTYKIGIDGTQDEYELIRLYLDEAIDKCGIRKSNDRFTKSDWRVIFGKIQKLIKSKAINSL